ncbi:MAG: hypothetical protein ABIS17_08025 [Casimicrobiaceae bacterium]
MALQSGRRCNQEIWMPADVRYTKTARGREEINDRRRNLPGKLRTMLILVDPAKSAEALAEQAAGIGADPAFIETLLSGGYIVPVAIGIAPAGSPGASAVADLPTVPRVHEQVTPTDEADAVARPGLTHSIPA